MQVLPYERQNDSKWVLENIFIGLEILYFHIKYGLYLKPSSKVAKLSRTHFIVVSEPSPYTCVAYLGAWLRIVQSFSLLLCPRSLPRVFIIFSYNKVVEKAIRRFPQFRNVASYWLNSQYETSWLYNVLFIHICITLFIHIRLQITNMAANCSAQEVLMPDIILKTL